jgi:hypothetical protein
MKVIDSIQFQLGPLKSERLGSPPPYDRLLDINAPLRIIVFGREWFSEPDFPVVELAAAVGIWLSRGGDFEFDSLEADESPFLSVHRMGSDCRIEAAWQAFRVDEPLAFDRVRDAFAGFVRVVGASTREQLHVDVDDLISPQAG